MDPENTMGAPGEPAPPNPRSWRERLRIDRSTAPAAAVVAMAVVSVTTAVMMSRQDRSPGDVRPPPHLAANAPVVTAPVQVVKAPPLNPRAPDTRSAGAGPGCRNCGVVESVVSRRASSYEMRVRMDDGSIKSIEQGAALPAGQRVVLEGGSLRAAPENG
jgi:hypothetical protein